MCFKLFDVEIDKGDEFLRSGFSGGIGIFELFGVIWASGGVLPLWSLCFFKKILSVERETVSEFLLRGGRHLSNSRDILSGLSTKTDEKLFVSVVVDFVFVLYFVFVFVVVDAGFVGRKRKEKTL